MLFHYVLRQRHSQQLYQFTKKQQIHPFFVNVAAESHILEQSCSLGLLPYFLHLNCLFMILFCVSRAGISSERAIISDPCLYFTFGVFPASEGFHNTEQIKSIVLQQRLRSFSYAYTFKQI